MTATHNTGPLIITGYAPGSGGSNPEAGPSASYQGHSLIDPRLPVLPGMFGPGHAKAFALSPVVTLVDAVPAAKSNTLVAPALAAAAAIAVLAQAFPLATTTAAGRAPNVPVVPFGLGLRASNVALAMALDPGHTVGTAANGSAVLTAVTDTRQIEPGTFLLVIGAGTGGTNLLARVIASSKVARTLTLDTTAKAAAAGAPLVVMDPTGVSAWPSLNAGAVQLFDPYAGLSRVLSVTAGAGDGGYVVTITGLDVFLAPVSEQITSVAATTVSGKKAMKYVLGATVARGTGGATVTTSLSIGTTDTFGLNLRSEKWEYLTVNLAGAMATASTGWTPGLAFNVPATQGGAGAADVRGTYTLQAPADGVARLQVSAILPIQQVADATYADPSSLFGPTQV